MHSGSSPLCCFCYLDMFICMKSPNLSRVYQLSSGAVDRKNCVASGPETVFTNEKATKKTLKKFILVCPHGCRSAAAPSLVLQTLMLRCADHCATKCVSSSRLPSRSNMKMSRTLNWQAAARFFFSAMVQQLIKKRRGTASNNNEHDPRLGI